MGTIDGTSKGGTVQSGTGFKAKLDTLRTRDNANDQKASRARQADEPLTPPADWKPPEWRK